LDAFFPSRTHTKSPAPHASISIISVVTRIASSFQFALLTSKEVKGKVKNVILIFCRGIITVITHHALTLKHARATVTHFHHPYGIG
jgi:hypothetical protein